MLTADIAKIPFTVIAYYPTKSLVGQVRTAVALGENKRALLRQRVGKISPKRFVTLKRDCVNVDLPTRTAGVGTV
jgi:hypothetical protein